MKYFFIIFFFLININFSYCAQKDRAYFAGGCFWCVEESFEKLKGVEEVISGYSGGITENPTYKEVTYGNTGHFEVVEIIYDKKVISFEELLENFWVNIDPFDAYGQFCDKGKSYRSVIFFEDDKQKKIIDESFQNLQKKLNKKIVTLVWDFEKFYQAENYHQDYYEKNFIRYLMYKKGCQREETLKKLWN